MFYFQASLKEYPVGGLVLHNPFYSFAAVLLKRFGNTSKNEPFPNSVYIQNVQTPTFIMSAQKDEVIPYDHGFNLKLLTKNLYEYWQVSGANHVNIELQEQYYFKMESFLHYLRESRKAYSEGELKSYYRGTTRSIDSVTDIELE